MKKELKQQVNNVFAAPLPQRKKEFLQYLNFPKTRWKNFFISQIGYIQKKVWLVSILLFFTVILFEKLVRIEDIRLMWVISALIPFLALMTVTEVVRSASFGMAELEMTTRYSLRSVLLARMGILGVGNLLLLLMIVPILTYKLNIGFVNIGVYLSVPYLLTCFLLFTLVNRIRTGELSFYCSSVAVGVSVIGFVLNSIKSEIYQQQYFTMWMVVLVLLVIAIYRALRKFINNLEELTWNSYLIA